MIIRNVTVIDGTGAAPLPEMEVVIEGERITAIHPARSGGDESAVVDGKGGFLVPGLWESHTHTTARVPLNAALAERAAQVERNLAPYLQAGITTVVDLGGPLDVLREVRARKPSASTALPQLFIAGPVFTGINGWPVRSEDHSMAYEVSDEKEGRDLVRRICNDVDIIKCIYDGEAGSPAKLSRAALGAILETARAAGKPTLVHVKTTKDLVEAVGEGADAIEHAILPEHPDSLDEAEQVATLLASAGTYYCPTLVTWEQLGRAGDHAYLSELVIDGILKQADVPKIATRPFFTQSFHAHPAAESYSRFHYGMASIPIMHRKGVKLVAGSDIPILMAQAPDALLRELQLFSKAGLPLHNVLLAATRYAAQKLGRGSVEGTITIGAVADALLLDADPLTHVNHLTECSHRIATIRRGGIISAGRNIEA